MVDNRGKFVQFLCRRFPRTSQHIVDGQVALCFLSSFQSQLAKYIPIIRFTIFIRTNRISKLRCPIKKMCPRSLDRHYEIYPLEMTLGNYETTKIVFSFFICLFSSSLPSCLPIDTKPAIVDLFCQYYNLKSTLV